VYVGVGVCLVPEGWRAGVCLATEECRAQALIKALKKALREKFRSDSGEGLPPNEALKVATL